jgi:methionine aminotransferase
MIAHHSKLPSVGTTIFTVMSKLAADVGAINLSQGFPDFDCDPELVAAVAAHMRAGRNQYAPMQGVLRLREAIAAHYEHAHRRRYDPEAEVTVTSGGTEAIFDAVAAMVRPGDEVIVLEPCYDSYVPAIEINGGTPVFVALRHRAHAHDPDQLAAQPVRGGARRRRHPRARRARRRHRHRHRQRRGLRAHHLRRRAAREHGAP